MLKITVGYTKKLGLPEYSSHGASCNVEVEIDGSLLSDPAALQARIEEAQSIARFAVENELAAASRPAPAAAPAPARQPAYTASANGNGYRSGSSNGNGYHAPPNGNGGGGYGPPTDGRQLMAWAKRESGRRGGGVDLKDAIIQWSQGRGLPSRIVDWPSNAAVDCYHNLSR